jgi:hypothetical protein
MAISIVTEGQHNASSVRSCGYVASRRNERNPRQEVMQSADGPEVGIGIV